MAESQTISTLRAKRDAIASAIANYERQLEQAKADFTHITAALEIFEAQDDPASQRSYVALYRYFKYGEIAGLCREYLEDGPQTTTELTRRVMAAKGLDPDERVLAKSVGFSVLRSLRGLAKRQTVKCTRRGNRCLWGNPERRGHPSEK